MSVPLKYGSRSENSPGMPVLFFLLSVEVYEDYYFCLVLEVYIAELLLKHRNLMPLKTLNLKMRPPCQTAQYAF